MDHEWTFPCTLTRVVDGDTLDVRCDMGFRVESDQRVRLGGVDTAEVHGVKHESDEFAAGSEQSAFVRDWFASVIHMQSFPFVLRSKKRAGKYGRWIGDIYCTERDEWLTDALITEFPEVDDR